MGGWESEGDHQVDLSDSHGEGGVRGGTSDVRHWMIKIYGFLRSYWLTGLRAYGLTGLQAYRLIGLQAYGLTGLRAYGLKGLRAYGLTGLRAYRLILRGQILIVL